ncbi:MAG: hypothetical protein ACRDZ4_02265 [Egibacteraceae bacterium]
MTTFCRSCGQPLEDAHAACDRRLALDPPRFCATCGFRLDVQVYPDRVETACRECRRRAPHRPAAAQGA